MSHILFPNYIPCPISYNPSPKCELYGSSSSILLSDTVLLYVMASEEAVWANPCRDCIEHGRGEDSDDGHDHGPFDPYGKYLNACVHTCPLRNPGRSGYSPNEFDYLVAYSQARDPPPPPQSREPPPSLPLKAPPPQLQQQLQQAVVKKARAELKKACCSCCCKQRPKAKETAAAAELHMGKANAPKPGQTSDAPEKRLVKPAPPELLCQIGCPAK